MTATQKLKSQLTPLLEALPGINYVEFAGGDSIDRFKADTITHAGYPAVFINAPEEKIIDTGAGNIWADFPLTIYVLTQKPADENQFEDRADWLSEENAFTAAEELTHEIYRQLRHQSHSLKIIFGENSSWKAERIMNVTLDLALGYEIRTTLTIHVSDLLC